MHIYLGSRTIRTIAQILPILFGALLSFASVASQIVPMLSPFNDRRPPLPGSNVQFIVLHTTEGRYPGCLEKLRKFGEAHFLVTSTGQIIQIMDVDRLAKHAGRSMWESSRAVDRFSIGIEVEGFHNIPPNADQREALGFLIKHLKSEFNVTNDRVLTHSMVAYGAPDRWHDDDHRGRKRCGMMMARHDVRTDLGLEDGPDNDPDVLATRLSIGDRPLFAFLFNQATPFSIFDSSPRAADEYIRVLLGSTQSTVPASPVPTQAAAAEDQSDRDEKVEFREIGKDGNTAFALAGNQYAAATTIYFLPDKRIRTGRELSESEPDLLNHLRAGTKVLVGFIYGGKVTSRRSAFSIVKNDWSDPSTIYRLPSGQLATGDQIEANQIASGTIILFQR